MYSFVVAAVLVSIAIADVFLTPKYPESFTGVALQTLGFVPLLPGTVLVLAFPASDNWARHTLIPLVCGSSLVVDAVLVWLLLSLTELFRRALMIERRGL